MSGNRGSVFSETLQEITNTKLQELSKRRSAFETTRSTLLSRLKDETEPLKRLELLSQGVRESYGIKTTKTGQDLSGPSKNPDLLLELKNLQRFMAQSKYDPSITPKMMQSWEESLLRHLDKQSSKLEYASLYAQLVTEWLSTEKATAAAGEDVEMNEGFEDVGDTMKKEARQGWEKVVFEPAGVDDKALKAYLLQLFGLKEGPKPAHAKAFLELRAELSRFENRLAAPGQFDSVTLTWVIEGLLASDLLADERREVLRDFLSSPTILAEVADVLNMRLASLSTWSWGESVAVEQQRKITGIYNVTMQEDVLQAIFLHYIGVKWSVFLNYAFKTFRSYDGAWKSSRTKIPHLDHKRREYYLGTDSVRIKPSVQITRGQILRKHYFMAGLMGHEREKQSSQEGEEEANYSAQPQVPIQQAAPHMIAQQRVSKKKKKSVGAPGGSRSARFMGAVSAYGASSPSYIDYSPTSPDFDDDDDDDVEDRRPMEDKQRLIRLLSAEIALNKSLHGDITAFHSAFESWNSLLPHETILNVMALLGVSEMWIAFFNKFLSAPLKFFEDGPEAKPRIRRRGTPASHALSKIFGESILFCLDFAVNQATGGHDLHRMSEDFWFWSRDHEVAKTAWKAVSDFSNATRTYIDFGKSGTVRIARDPALADIDESLPVGDIRWGFLRLSTHTGKFEIDQKMVDKHIVDLRRQLADKRKSVIAFIQAWNTFAATFFTSNFGQPANCFGRAHVDEILATHQRIQREVFSSPSPLLAGEAAPSEPITGVVAYLKHLLRARFGVSEIPDAYLFFPIELGGLDLRSPFIATLPIREAVVADPGKLLETFAEAERDAYARKKLAFERGNPTAHFKAVNWEPENARERETFMGFDEYARYREDLRYDFANNLASVFDKLLEVPEGGAGGIGQASTELSAALAGLENGASNIRQGWGAMEPYWRWVAQLYGPEAIRRFGGLNIVEPGLLPMGMVSIFRDKRVKWQG
ncbi:hypothetical protein F4808DRAFT_407734 [Astrocystis sublimbata]|nr:hypothetical protein F4808DRAFT_407734 [Astrocystis sublimbata]